jgi:hypothetical protein
MLLAGLLLLLLLLTTDGCVQHNVWPGTPHYLPPEHVLKLLVQQFNALSH